MKKFIGILLFILLVSGIGVNAIHKPQDAPVQKETTALQIAANTTEPTQEVKEINEGTLPDIPQRIRIPAIALDAKVEPVGEIGPKRKMDVPKDADNGGWYELGTKPGNKGSAVIAGHYDKEDSSPAIFWNLPKISVGDTIIVTDEQGTDRKFAVIKKAQYPYDNFPLQEVFGSSSESLLNLITCQGDWNTGAKEYSHRLVVYAKLVEE